jgi:hypothetical protein
VVVQHLHIPLEHFPALHEGESLPTTQVLLLEVVKRRDIFCRGFPRLMSTEYQFPLSCWLTAPVWVPRATRWELWSDLPIMGTSTNLAAKANEFSTMNENSGAVKAIVYFIFKISDAGRKKNERVKEDLVRDILY